jgi:hypothetical protein
VIRTFLTFILVLILPGVFALGDPPIKLFPDNFEPPKREDPPTKEIQSKECLPCQGVRQVTGYSRGIETEEALKDYFGVDFKRNENGVFVSKPKIDLHHRGVSYVISDTVSVNVKKSKTEGTTTSIEKNIIGSDTKVKAQDFSDKIKSFRDRKTDDN